MGEWAGGPNLTESAQEAIRDAITDDPAGHPPHHAGLPVDLTDAQRQEMRAIGRQLVGLVLRYAAGETGEGVLEQARQMGTSYGRLCRRAGMSVSTTIATFNFYRNPILEVTFESVAKTGELDVSEPQLYRRLDRFFNEVLMATVSAAGKHPSVSFIPDGLSFVHYLPIITTLLAAAFSLILIRRYRTRGGMHHIWWSGWDPGLRSGHGAGGLDYALR